jgi:serine/threonine-protein kinase
MGEADERIGSLVDERYKVLEAMASGSMGAVYKAERIPVGKLVAIKFLKASFANDSEFLGRFERETRVMSKLAHPNCVSVVDFGVSDGAPYLVMEYVSGTTLRSIIDRQVALPVPRALTIARQVASGLAHAHAQGIVHRDVKPANIMITDEIGTGEHVRILDFGLARLRGNVGRDATQTNMVVGTPNYMAPEQTVPGGMIDMRTDVYAVGVVLYEMIVGKRPFQAEDTMALLGMHRAAPIPRLADVLPTGFEIPDGLQEVVDKAMAKAPGDRYQTAIDLASAIDELGSTPRPMGSTGSSRVMAVASDRPPPKYPTAAIASTIQLDIDSAMLIRAQAKKSRFALGTLLLLGGIAAGAVYLVKRGEQESTDMLARASGASGETGSATTPNTHVVESGSAVEPVRGSAVAVVAGSDTGSAASDTGSAEGSAHEPTGSGSAIASGSGSAIVVEPTPVDANEPTAVGSGSGSGSAGDEIEIEPEKAVDLDPTGTGSGSSAKDEAADAPATREAVESRLPAPTQPTLAPTVADAVQLIKDGKRELALSSLRALDRKPQNQRSAYIPFLLGNLYFDKLWWGVAMDEYSRAIQRNGGYKSNATINKNLITMLGSTKTSGRAYNFIRSIGRPAIYFLRANRDENPLVKRQVERILRGR